MNELECILEVTFTKFKPFVWWASRSLNVLTRMKNSSSNVDCLQFSSLDLTTFHVFGAIEKLSWEKRCLESTTLHMNLNLHFIKINKISCQIKYSLHVYASSCLTHYHFVQEKTNSRIHHWEYFFWNFSMHQWMNSILYITKFMFRQRSKIK